METAFISSEYRTNYIAISSFLLPGTKASTKLYEIKPLSEKRVIISTFTNRCGCITYANDKKCKCTPKGLLDVTKSCDIYIEKPTIIKVRNEIINDTPIPYDCCSLTVISQETITIAPFVVPLPPLGVFVKHTIPMAGTEPVREIALFSHNCIAVLKIGDFEMTCTPSLAPSSHALKVIKRTIPLEKVVTEFTIIIVNNRPVPAICSSFVVFTQY